MAQFLKIQPSNNDMIKYILNLIRYDIPILMAGKSSIGKSFTILGLAEKWYMPNAVLYVGSEKADNIEGLPKLMEDVSEKENVLTYFKPYWYPKANLIQDSVARGLDVWNGKIVSKLSNKYSYNTLMGMLFAIRNIKFDDNSDEQTFDFVDNSGYVTSTPNTICTGIKLKRQIPTTLGQDQLELENDLADLSLFLSTLVGLGNYWLVLDELDKVDPEQADKFAPMLHIVRERRLKTYNMRLFNNGEGSNVAKNVTNGDYTPIYNKIVDSIKNNKPILDTRIIAISNKTNNIIEISDALFKRFIQVIVNDILILDNVETKLTEIRNCLKNVETKVGGVQGDLQVGRLQEINLQWQFGFLPRILNSGDVDGNYIKKNYEEYVGQDIVGYDENASGGVTRLDEAVKLSIKNNVLLYKLCIDNFEEVDETSLGDKILDDNGNPVKIPNLVYGCLIEQFTLSDDKQEATTALGVLDAKRKELGEDYTDLLLAKEIYDHLLAKHKLIKDDSQRETELNNLIISAFDFIKYTAYQDSENVNPDKRIANNDKYEPLSINSYLIPIVIKFILKAITKDEFLSFDQKENLMNLHAQLWSNFTLPDYIEELKGDPNLTKELFYEGEDSLWGSPDLDADAFQESFVNRYTTDNFPLFEEFILDYIEITNVDEKENLADFIEYIKKYRKDDLKKVYETKFSQLKEEAKLDPSKSSLPIDFNGKFYAALGIKKGFFGK